MTEPLIDVRKAADRVPGTVLAICATVTFAIIVGAFVFLSATGSDATEFRQFINTVMNAAGVILAGTGAVAAGVAAKSAGTAVKQTNGQLDDRIITAIQAALESHAVTAHGKDSGDGRPTV